MDVELDHIFICTQVGAPEAEHLLGFGLTEGSSSIHPGQGTANRRFFFHNLMLELLWVHDTQEVQSEEIRPTHLWERWSGRDRGACPFGISLRPASVSAPQSSLDLPFSHWSYHPPYLPSSLAISVADNANLVVEPMLFYIPFGRRQDTYPSHKAEPLQDSVDLCEVTTVTLSTPFADTLSPGLEALSNRGLLHVQQSSRYHLTLTFNGMNQGYNYSFQPHLPLTFRSAPFTN